MTFTSVDSFHVPATLANDLGGGPANELVLVLDRFGKTSQADPFRTPARPSKGWCTIRAMSVRVCSQAVQSEAAASQAAASAENLDGCWKPR